MKTILRITIIAISLVLMLFADISILSVQLVPDADAIFGVRRRAFRRGVIIGEAAATSSATAATSQQQASTAQQQSATAQQQSVTAQQQSATAQQQAAAAPPPAPAPSGGGAPLPLGTVVSALPAGCASTPIGGVAYYKCGSNYYRAVFQGNSLVYVTAQPQ